MNTAKQTKRLTIYDIKRLSSETESYFFSAKTMKCFGQTLKSFSVKKIDSENYFIQAPRKSGGFTERYFNTITNELNHKINN